MGKRKPTEPVSDEVQVVSKKRGRKSKYKPESGEVVVEAAEAGSSVTDEEIAALFGVNEQTVKNWYKQYPEFLASVKRAKSIADDKVERSLFERGTGYSHPDVHITGKGKIIPIIKHYPPDPTSMIFWLKNRRPKDWREKTEVEHSGNVTLNDAAVALGIAKDGTPPSGER